jgi:quercetin dioxygenase-like cupin family protein
VLFHSSDEHLSPPDGDANGRATKVVGSFTQARIVNIALVAGSCLSEHTSPNPILLQVLSGCINFTCNGEITQLAQGGLVSVGRGIPHALDAVMASSLLITFLL